MASRFLMDPQALAQTQKMAAGLIDSVTPEQLELPTPCATWNVGQLIDHLVGGQHWARSGVAGEPMTETGDGASQGDFRASFADASQRCLDAFSKDGALDRTVNPGFGDMPATALLGLAITDTFTHAWDLATATGQDNNLAPELAGQLLAASRHSIRPEFRTEDGSLFLPEQPAPDGANPATQLAAFLGRTV